MKVVSAIIKHFTLTPREISIVTQHKSLKGWQDQIDFHTMLDWLDGSRYIKEQRQMWQAAKVFARIFSRGSDIDVRDIIGDTQEINGEALGRARARLDIVCMSLFRKVWQLCPPDIDIFIWLDSSPQIKRK